MEILKCKACGGELEFTVNSDVCTCIYCGSIQTRSNITDAQKIRLFNRGNRFRIRAEYDEAIKTFENIIVMDDTDAEAHWCLALSRHGIEYVDSANGKVPTCNRIGYETILEDVDYQDALQYSTPEQREVYVEEANRISKTQLSVMQKSKKVDPFDIFICFKDKDEHGERTEDSVIGQELYEHLNKAGYKVFFSRVTLEDKPGIEFEPYIFAALQSSKIMIVVGTQKNYVESPWVRNEWSRFLTLAKKDPEKLIVPYIKNIEPDDLPDELAALQYYNHAKVGVLQDLLHVIHKQIGIDSGKSTGASTKIDNMLHLCHQALDDKKWPKAADYVEKILLENSKVGLAYYYRMMADLRVSDETELVGKALDISGNSDLRRAKKYGTPELIQKINQLEQDLRAECEKREQESMRRKQEELRAAREQQQRELEEKSRQEAAARFAAEEKLRQQEEQKRQAEIQAAREREENIRNARNLVASAETYMEKKYAAIKLCNLGLSKEARRCFNFYSLLEDGIQSMCPSKDIYHGIVYSNDGLLVTASGYAVDSEGDIYQGAIKQRIVSGVKWLLFEDGTVKSTRTGSMRKYNNAAWTNLCDIQAHGNMVLGLTREGRIVAVDGNIFKRNKLSKWDDIKQISASSGIIAACTNDGRVYALGENVHGQCNVDNWTDVVQVSAGGQHTVALRSDGTVVATGINDDGQCNVSDWTDILAVKAYDHQTIGLKPDGTLVSTKADGNYTKYALFLHEEYENYSKATKRQLNEKSSAEDIASRIEQLWAEKKTLKIWQISKRKELLAAIQKLLEQFDAINKGLPAWYQAKAPKDAAKWISRNETGEQYISDSEWDNTVKGLLTAGGLLGFLGGAIFIYYDSGGDLFSGGFIEIIAELFACTIILAVAILIGIVSAFIIFGVVKAIIAIIKEIRKI